MFKILGGGGDSLQIGCAAASFVYSNQESDRLKRQTGM